ncbi:MAG: hypothetical protein JZU47_22350 [Prolixibacteraceae bacterium]|nr:hypothetical protein [Prolixibacteraceae bacterium]
MIDTIVLRIHNLQKNSKIVDILRAKGSGETFYDIRNPHRRLVNLDTGELSEKPDDFMEIKAMEFGDTGKTQIFYRNKIAVTSSHYYMAYSIRIDRDYIEFNFSIPKFIYGTNLVQFVPHHTENARYNTRNEIEDLKTVQNLTYDRLISFLKAFLKKYFHSVYDFDGIDLNDVEINRLDICFNQHFNSKKEALKYLEFQKKIKKRYIRETSKNKIDWVTSIFLQTERYSAKIYHKGSEYNSSNGERKHHEQINKKKKQEIFKIENKYDKNGMLIYEGLQSYSDRILRYEISFRNAMMSHLYRKKIFAKSCSLFKTLRTDFKEVDSIQKKCERLMNKKVENPLKEFNQLSKEKKANHKLYKSIMSKTVSFRLKVSEETKKANSTIHGMKFSKKHEASLPLETRFSRALLDEMFKMFNSFLKQFKVEVKENVSNAGKRVAQYNNNIDSFNMYVADGVIDKVKSKINPNKVRQVIMLLQTNSLDELEKNGVISRATKYNYINMLKHIGLKPNQLAVDEIHVQTTIDFSGYCDYTMGGFCALPLVNRYFA